MKVTCSPRQIKTVQGTQVFRKQYSLIHIVVSTINKQTGNTIPNFAIEFLPQCCPWHKPQIVVSTSRTKHGKCTILVGAKKEFILNAMWKIITTGDRWTYFIEELLKSLSIHVTDEQPALERETVASIAKRKFFSYADVFPFWP